MVAPREDDSERGKPSGCWTALDTASCLGDGCASLPVAAVVGGVVAALGVIVASNHGA